MTIPVPTMSALINARARGRLYPLVGAALALGAPLGLLALEAMSGDTMVADGLTYAYVTISTVVAFVLLGVVLGRSADRLAAMATTDLLTGLANRGHFTATLARELRRAERYATPLAILMIDVDHLKRINDAGGHRAGDQALARIGASIRESVRATDIPARYGGDEFAVLLPHTAAADAAVLAERIRARAHLLIGDIPLSVSIGIADTDDGGASALVSRADAALYASKATGRDRISVAPKPAAE